MARGWTGEDEDEDEQPAQPPAPPPLSTSEKFTPGEELIPLGKLLEHVGDGDALDAAAQEAAEELLKRHARRPPHDLDTERAVLGAILLSTAVLDDVLDQGLVPSDFYRPTHAQVFRTMLQLRARGEPVDTLTVVDELMRVGQLEQVGGAAAISQLEAMLPTTAHAAAYARLVHEKSKLRKLIEAGSLIVQSAFRQDRRVDEIVHDAERSILAIGHNPNVHKDVDRHTVIERVMTAATSGASADSKVAGSITTGFWPLDDILRGGFRRGQFIVVGARPGMGKSSIGLQFCMAAADAGVRAGFVSLEMTEDELIEREVAIGAKRPIDTWTRRDEGAKAQEAAGRAHDRGIVMSDRFGLTAPQVVSIVRRWVRDHGIGLVVVDHFHKLDFPGRGRPDHEMTEASKLLSAAAGQLGIAVVVLAQLNRDVEKRSDKRPVLSDLRECGGLEQDAHLVLLLYRAAYYTRDNTKPGDERLAEVIVEKQRGGATGIVQLFWDGPTTRFIAPRRAIDSMHASEEEE
jgi:replicative DNA helicase